MKTKSLIIALLTAAGMLGAASASHGQPKNQAGGLPALAEEVAVLRAIVAGLQEQIGGSADPYTGTYAVTLMEASFYGCRMLHPAPVPPAYVQGYFVPQAASSASIRSAKFDVEADGAVLHIPEFELLTQELLLDGHYRSDVRIEAGADVAIGGDGSFQAAVADGILTGQFANDGSMFSALVVGQDLASAPGECDDVWTVHLTGVRK